MKQASKEGKGTGDSVVRWELWKGVVVAVVSELGGSSSESFVGAWAMSVWAVCVKMENRRLVWVE